MDLNCILCHDKDIAENFKVKYTFGTLPQTSHFLEIVMGQVTDLSEIIFKNNYKILKKKKKK